MAPPLPPPNLCLWQNWRFEKSLKCKIKNKKITNPPVSELKKAGPTAPFDVIDPVIEIDLPMIQTMPPPRPADEIVAASWKWKKEEDAFSSRIGLFSLLVTYTQRSLHRCHRHQSCSIIVEMNENKKKRNTSQINALSLVFFIYLFIYLSARPIHTLTRRRCQSRSLAFRMCCRLQLQRMIRRSRSSCFLVWVVLERGEGRMIEETCVQRRETEGETERSSSKWFHTCRAVASTATSRCKCITREKWENNKIIKHSISQCKAQKTYDPLQTHSLPPPADKNINQNRKMGNNLYDR